MKVFRYGWQLPPWAIVALWIETICDFSFVVDNILYYYIRKTIL